MINKLRIFILFLSIAAVSPVWAVPSHAVVLMYHRFDEHKFPSTSIKVSQFIKQLDYLTENGFNFWPLEKIVEHLKTKKSIPDKTIAITIDDAYLSVYQHAYPILKQRNIPFTIFVSTKYIDKGFSSYMSWDQLAEMVKNGVNVGNHSSTHDHLIQRHKGELHEAWLTRVAEDIFKAEYRIQEKTGVQTILFAYPYGEYNRVLANYVKELGYSAFGQQSGPIGEYSDFSALPRFPVSDHFSDMAAFKNKVFSLPLPVVNESPQEVVTILSLPSLQIELQEDLGNDKHTLRCFASGQGEVHATWLNKTQFVVRALEPFHIRRSRYNCTIHNRKLKRYYWHSHLWIKPQLPESPSASNTSYLRQELMLKRQHFLAGDQVIQ